MAELKKEGDERFRAKDYQQAASIYLTALNCPIPLFLDVSVISEQLFRRRAECLFKLVSIFPKKQIYTLFAVNFINLSFIRNCDFNNDEVALKLQPAPHYARKFSEHFAIHRSKLIIECKILNVSLLIYITCLFFFRGNILRLSRTVKEVF